VSVLWCREKLMHVAQIWLVSTARVAQCEWGMHRCILQGMG
jgi:hypothetical protein